MRIFLYHGYWDRQTVARDTKCVYLFGDNLADAASGYVLSRTQAVIRGLPNAIGIPTKKTRGTDPNAYFTDKELTWFAFLVDVAIHKALESGKDIVIPADGIGTGKAQLKERAPECYECLVNRLNYLVKVAREQNKGRG